MTEALGGRRTHVCEHILVALLPRTTSRPAPSPPPATIMFVPWLSVAVCVHRPSVCLVIRSSCGPHSMNLWCARFFWGGGEVCSCFLGGLGGGGLGCAPACLNQGGLFLSRGFREGGCTVFWGLVLPQEPHVSLKTSATPLLCRSEKQLHTPKLLSPKQGGEGISPGKRHACLFTNDT